MITTAETEFPGLLSAGRPMAETMVLTLWPHRDPAQLPEAKAGMVVTAQINHGRWIVRCPFCPGAQMASETDRRFHCVDCRHRGTEYEGRWLLVSWPDPTKRRKVEATLEPRRLEERNWTARESLVDLKAENRAHDLPESVEVA